MINYTKLLKNINIDNINENLTQLYKIYEIDDFYKNCYFWTPSFLSSTRKSKEVESIIIVELSDSDVIKYEYKYTESCKHCYFSKNITLNDEHINMKSINTIIRKLEEIKKQIQGGQDNENN